MIDWFVGVKVIISINNQKEKKRTKEQIPLLPVEPFVLLVCVKCYLLA